MKIGSMRNAIVIASVIVGSVIPSQAFAQTAVLNILGGETLDVDYKDVRDGSFSTFTFQQSFILNSVGFTTGVDWQFDSLVKSYKIGDADWVTITDQLALESNGVGYYNFTNPQTYAAGTQISIKGTWGDENKFRKFDAINVAGITHSTSEPGYASGNLRVTASNPGSNVAPEPGSFALAMTGGAALIGICIRRRRNAA
jgi:hypothetical protein